MMRRWKREEKKMIQSENVGSNPMAENTFKYWYPTIPQKRGALPP
jgi:hypothetical protein